MHRLQAVELAVFDSKEACIATRQFQSLGAAGQDVLILYLHYDGLGRSKKHLLHSRSCAIEPNESNETQHEASRRTATLLGSTAAPLAASASFGPWPGTKSQKGVPSKLDSS